MRPLLYWLSFNRPRPRWIVHGLIFFEQLFCQFKVLFRNPQPHTASNFCSQWMHAVHVLVAQETVYPTRVKQAFGHVRFMQAIEGGGCGQLLRFSPIGELAICPENWRLAFPGMPWCLPFCLPWRSTGQTAWPPERVLPAKSYSCPDSPLPCSIEWRAAPCR